MVADLVQVLAMPKMHCCPRQFRALASKVVDPHTRVKARFHKIRPSFFTSFPIPPASRNVVKWLFSLEQQHTRNR
jgi:hypothetical protein